MHVLRHGHGVARRWLLLVLALQLCGFGAAGAGWAPSGVAIATPAPVRAVIVPNIAAPTSASRRGVEETRATASPERTPGSVVRVRAGGPAPSDGPWPVVPVVDVPETVTTRVTAALWSVVVPARGPAAPGVRADIDARGPPRAGVVLSVVPPIRSAG